MTPPSDELPTIDYRSAAVPSAEEAEPASSMSAAGFAVAAFVLIAASFPWIAIIAFGLLFFGVLGWAAAAAVLFLYVVALLLSFLYTRRVKVTEDTERGVGMEVEVPSESARHDAA